MSGAWMLYVLLVGTLLACAATAVDGVVRRTIVPTRWVWAAALAGLMILVSIVPHRGSHAAGPIAQVVAARTPPMGGMAPTGSAIAAAVRSAREYIALSIAATIGVVDSGTRHRFMIPLVATWGLLSVAIVAMLVVVNRQVARARRSWPVVQLHGFAVRITPDVGPAVIGVARPEIVVPRWLLRRSDEEQRLVVVHEREHVAACDQVVLTGAWIAAALLPWHPAVWWMLSRLRLAIELDCDARVLRRGVPARSYGALLIDIAGQCASLRVGALALADRTTHLERRLLAMKPSRSRFAFLRVATLGTSAALLLAAACEARLPTSTEVASMDVAAAEKAATSLLLPKDLARAVYIVNGVVVTEAEAHAIAGSSIMSIEVSRSKASAPSQVLITTKAVALTADSVTITIPAEKGKLVAEKRANASRQFEGLILIDGVKATSAEMASLGKDAIASVEVVKGPGARLESSDPAAEFGIIKITKKKPAP